MTPAHHPHADVFRESLYVASSEIPTERMAILTNDEGSVAVVLRAPRSTTAWRERC